MCFPYQADIPIYSQHNQCPCSRLIHERHSRRSSVVTNYETQIHISQIQEGNLAMHCQPKNEHVDKKQKNAKPAHQTSCSKKQKKKKTSEQNNALTTTITLFTRSSCSSRALRMCARSSHCTDTSTHLT